MWRVIVELPASGSGAIGRPFHAAREARAVREQIR
jgi:hypothetical protein